MIAGVLVKGWFGVESKMGDGRDGRDGRR